MSAPTIDCADDVRWQWFAGHIEIQTRMRPEGDKIIGEGRSLHYDGQGQLVKETPWTTNCVLSFDYSRSDK